MVFCYGGPCKLIHPLIQISYEAFVQYLSAYSSVFNVPFSPSIYSVPSLFIHIFSCTYSIFLEYKFHRGKNFCLTSLNNWASLVAQLVKRLPAMQETLVGPLAQEDLLEKEMATHSSILAWRIPGTEEPGMGHSPWGRKSQTQFSN